MENILENSAIEAVDGRYGALSYFSEDPVIGQALRLYGEWAENELTFFANFIPVGGTVLDIGGFIGTHALAFARFVGPSGKVHSFEPQPVSFQLLKHNMEANGLSNVTMHHAAVGDQPGKLALEPLVLGSATNFGGLTVGGDGETLVDVETIDSLGLDVCSFIKCDVEGMEHVVLRGGAATIRGCKPVIYCEANSLDAAVKTLEMLRELGYSVFGHVADAFNPNNLFNEGRNIFGVAREFGLVGVPAGQESLLTSLKSEYWQIFPLETVDDLAFAILQKHQYFDEVLRAGRAAAAGGRVISGPDHAATENELVEIRSQAVDILSQLEAERASHAFTHQRVEAVSRELMATQSARSTVEHQLALSQSACDAVEQQLALSQSVCNTLEQQLALSQSVRNTLEQQLALSQSARSALELQLSDVLHRLTRIERSNIYRLFKRLVKKEMNFREERKRRRKARAGETAPAAVDARFDHAVTAAAGPIKVLPIGLGLNVSLDSKTSDRPLMICVAHVSPVLPRAGNEYRIARLLAFIRELGIEVIFIYAPLPGEEPDEAKIAQISQSMDNVVVVDRNGTLRAQLADARAAEVLSKLDGEPVNDYADRLGERTNTSGLLSITRTFSPDLLVQLIVEMEKRLSPFCVMVNYGFMSRSFPLLGDQVLKVIDTHDVFSTKAEKVNRFGISDSLSITGEEEATLMRSADLLLAIQSDEAKELEALGCMPEIITVGVDMPEPPLAQAIVESPRILMVASLNEMNRKGLNDFIRFAWPVIRAAVPEAELDVVGSVGRVLTGHEPGVNVIGFVDDLSKAYSGCRLVINPAVAGTGLKIKTLEALSHLRPIVLWPAGLDGVSSELREHCRCVLDWHQYAQEVIELLRDPNGAESLLRARDDIARVLSAEFTYSELKRKISDKIPKREYIKK